MIEAHSSEDYLTNIVLLANLNLKTSIVDFTGFTNHELLALADFFKRESLIYLTRAVFYYKLFPEKLFNEKIHSEKLMSVKSRLSLLYEFIELFHSELSKIISQRHLGYLSDDLLHNDHLPKGIEITCTNEDRMSILSALRLWRFGSALEHNEEFNDRYLKNIFRAYKFWFNPNRLIDAVMVLNLRLNLINDNNSDNKTFYDGLLNLYSQQSTANCLDLYGYFANNDTCYLMRTLLALQQNISLSWFRSSEQSLLVVRKVYIALETAMNALREELNKRQIKTEAYNRDLPKEIIKPGRRNREAIKRVVAIYMTVEANQNDKIDKLFKQLESFTVDS